jgi:hypothetical protein
MRRLRSSALLVAFAALVLALGCSGRSVSTPPAEPLTSASSSATPTPVPTPVATPVPRREVSTAPVRVSVTPHAVLNGDVLAMSGTTDLVDASVLIWEVGRWSDGSGTPYRKGKVTVADGKFSFDANVSSVPGKTLYAFLVYAMDGQPDSAVAKYGDFGQNLRSSHLVRQGDYRMLEYWVQVKR